ncbi:NfeD family protein [Aerosakkonemataceae cyanobacterium BLCC-F50]|uniref:NfeD family protein n=1 Tax=Floridaenema flaviceps BLCC-F50 TaxID=3153642 RepID=A0ABV4XJ68_9CYAN
MKNSFIPIPSDVETFPEPLEGIIEQTIALNQSGRVKFLGIYWPARFYETDCQETVFSNQLVMTVAIKGITLLILPVDKSRVN